MGQSWNRKHVNCRAVLVTLAHHLETQQPRSASQCSHPQRSSCLMKETPSGVALTRTPLGAQKGSLLLTHRVEI